MNYRVAQILPEETKTAAGTKIIDIIDTDVISRIEIKYNVTRTTHTMSAHPAGDITKIELVDGAKVIASLNGYECQALNIYNRKCDSMNHGQHYAGNGEVSLYGLDFGRWLWDEQLALDPKKFRNLQLKITHTLTTCDAGATTATLEVLGYMFDDKSVSPTGCLVAKEHYSYTPGTAGSYEYINLPIDMPIKNMLVRAYADGYEPWYVLSGIRIDENNLKKVPLDIGLETYSRIMKSQWSMIKEMLVGAGSTTGRAIYVTPTQYYSLYFGISSEADYALSNAWGSKGGKLAVVTHSANSPIAGMAFGWLPNHCFEFAMGNPHKIEDWYDVAKIGIPRVRLTSGSLGGTGATGAIVLEQLMKY